MFFEGFCLKVQYRYRDNFLLKNVSANELGIQFSKLMGVFQICISFNDYCPMDTPNDQINLFQNFLESKMAMVTCTSPNGLSHHRVSFPWNYAIIKCQPNNKGYININNFFTGFLCSDVGALYGGITVFCFFFFIEGCWSTFIVFFVGWLIISPYEGSRATWKWPTPPRPLWVWRWATCTTRCTTMRVAIAWWRRWASSPRRCSWTPASSPR